MLMHYAVAWITSSSIPSALVLQLALSYPHDASRHYGYSSQERCLQGQIGAASQLPDSSSIHCCDCLAQGMTCVTKL